MTDCALLDNKTIPLYTNIQTQVDHGPRPERIQIFLEASTDLRISEETHTQRLLGTVNISSLQEELRVRSDLSQDVIVRENERISNIVEVPLSFCIQLNVTKATFCPVSSFSEETVQLPVLALIL